MSRRRDSDPRLAVYKTATLPLSYFGDIASIHVGVILSEYIHAGKGCIEFMKIKNHTSVWFFRLFNTELLKRFLLSLKIGEDIRLTSVARTSPCRLQILQTTSKVLICREKIKLHSLISKSDFSISIQH